VVAQLRNVAAELAQSVGDGLGVKTLPDPLPLLLKRAPKPEVLRANALALTARPGKAGINARRRHVDPALQEGHRS